MKTVGRDAIYYALRQNNFECAEVLKCFKREVEKTVFLVSYTSKILFLGGKKEESLLYNVPNEILFKIAFCLDDREKLSKKQVQRIISVSTHPQFSVKLEREFLLKSVLHRVHVPLEKLEIDKTLKSINTISVQMGGESNQLYNSNYRNSFLLGFFVSVTKALFTNNNLAERRTFSLWSKIGYFFIFYLFFHSTRRRKLFFLTRN